MGNTIYFKASSTVIIEVTDFMIPRIKTLKTRPDYMLEIVFTDGKKVIYDVKDDIKTIPGYSLLASLPGLFSQAAVDESKTVVYWNDEIDLPSDTLYEYGKPMQ